MNDKNEKLICDKIHSLYKNNREMNEDLMLLYSYDFDHPNYRPELIRLILAYKKILQKGIKYE